MSSIYISEPTTSGKVCLKTSVGDIDIELWCRECPKACRNFIQLCMEGYYNGCIFHRVVKDFIAQGGDPTGTGTGGESVYGQPFKDEFHSRLRFNRRGLVAMANAGKNDNASQFFFTLGDTGELQGKHTLFGKVVGDTLFNMIKLGESATDDHERPLNPQKILSAEILTNPFEDIVPRELKSEKKKKDKKEKGSDSKMKATKNYSLLSFGDEAEEDEETVKKVTSKKGKSAHDVLAGVDERLSQQPAVSKEELGEAVDGDKLDGDNDVSGDREEMSKMRARLREKLGKQLNRGNDTVEQDEDMDLQHMVETEEQQRKRKQVEGLKAELKTLQKGFMKDLRKPKEKVVVEEEVVVSEGRKVYEDLRGIYMSKTQGLLKQKDTGREDQTMKMLEKFKTRLEKTNREAILFDRKLKTVDGAGDTATESVVAPTGEQQGPSANKSTEKDQPPGTIDLDAEDVEGDDWMATKFVAPEDESGVSKAKDANMKDVSEEWYDIYDPRNPMNQRRRVEGAVEGLTKPTVDPLAVVEEDPSPVTKKKKVF